MTSNIATAERSHEPKSRVATYREVIYFGDWIIAGRQKKLKEWRPTVGMRSTRGKIWRPSGDAKSRRFIEFGIPPRDPNVKSGN